MPDALDHLITEEAIETYRCDGVVHVPGAIDPDWRSVVSAGIKRNRQEPGPFFRDQTRDGDPARYVFDYWTWRDIPEFKHFIMNSPMARMAGRIMQQSRVTLLMDNWFMNETGATNAAPWHQDKPYFDYEGNMCNVLLTLDPTPREEGLSFAKGSHKDDTTYKAIHFRDHIPFKGQSDTHYADIPDIDGDGVYDVVGWALEPGDCLIFDLRTLHRGPNHNDQASARRRRYSLRFGASDTVFRPRGDWTAEISEHLILSGQAIGEAVKNPLCPSFDA